MPRLLTFWPLGGNWECGMENSECKMRAGVGKVEERGGLRKHVQSQIEKLTGLFRFFASQKDAQPVAWGSD